MSGERARPIALITGAGRVGNIGSAIARQLAATGWDIGIVYWNPYDDRMPWSRDPEVPGTVEGQLRELGARTCAIESDLADAAAPGAIFDKISQQLGQVTALIMSHCESVDSGILDTTVDSFDRHFAVNARASWLLIREFALRYEGPFGDGRIIALTSDHTVRNMPYGASKGALDRLTIAAAKELSHLGVTANAVNPGPVNTGWMSQDLIESVVRDTPLGRLGLPSDCANLISFLCSPAGGWINGQLICSNGGL